MKPTLSVYVPVYGRVETTIRFLNNIDDCYAELVSLTVVVIDCLGSKDLAAYINKSSGGSKKLLIKGERSDYWGACINMAIHHFLASTSQYFLLCNNDSYHLKESSSSFVNCLGEKDVLVSQVINVPFSFIGCVHMLQSPLLNFASTKDFKLDGGVYFDAHKCCFAPATHQLPNVAPTVALAVTRDFLIRVGKSVFVPRCIPHYLSDYHFTHQLYKKGASLVAIDKWKVLRFENENLESQSLSLFSVRSKKYLPAWVAFLCLNSNPFALLRKFVLIIICFSGRILIRF